MVECAKEDGELGNMNKTIPGRVKWIKTTKLSGLWGSMILTALLYLKCSQKIQPSKYKIPVVFLTTKEDIIQATALKKPDCWWTKLTFGRWGICHSSDISQWKQFLGKKKPNHLCLWISVFWNRALTVLIIMKFYILP